MKKLFLTIVLAAVAGSVFAQDWTRYNEDAGTYERVTKRGPYLTNRFFDNWFIGVAGGVNMYVGEGDHRADFGDRLAPALDAYIGKWVTPSVGFRFQYSGLKAKGASAIITDYTDTFWKDDQNYYEKRFNYWNMHGDILWNASHAIGGYKYDRTWNFVPFAGFGVVESYKNTDNKKHNFAFSMGLLNNIRITDVLDITLEAKYMLTKADFDKYRPAHSKKVDGMLSLTAGLAFKLGPKGGFKRPIAVAPANYTPYQQRINALENELADANARINRLQRELDAANNRPTTTPQAGASAASVIVYFTINSAVISAKEMTNVEKMARTIKAHPGEKFTVAGYADSATGTPAINQSLSQRRADAVADALVNKFGVNRSQLIIEAKGGVRTQPIPALDRKVIVEGEE